MAASANQADSLSPPPVPRRASTGWSLPPDSAHTQRPVAAGEIRVSPWQEIGSLEPTDPATEDTPPTAVPGSFRFLFDLEEDGTTEATAMPDDDELAALQAAWSEGPEDGTTEATAMPDDDELAALQAAWDDAEEASSDLAVSSGAPVVEQVRLDRSAPSEPSGAPAQTTRDLRRLGRSGVEDLPEAVAGPSRGVPSWLWLAASAAVSAVCVLALAWALGWTA